MSVDNETRQLLSQLEGQRDGEFLARAAKLATILRAGAAAMLIMTAITLYQGEHPVFAAFGAAGFGWATTEANSIRHRLRSWPIFSRYIDWERVQGDLGSRA